MVIVPVVARAIVPVVARAIVPVPGTIPEVINLIGNEGNAELAVAEEKLGTDAPHAVEAKSSTSSATENVKIRMFPIASARDAGDAAELGDTRRVVATAAAQGTSSVHAVIVADPGGRTESPCYLNGHWPVLVL